MLAKFLAGIVIFVVCFKFIVIGLTVLIAALTALVNLGVIVITVLCFVVVGAIAAL